MQSAEVYGLLWWTYYCDDTQDMYAVCQLPTPPVPGPETSSTMMDTTTTVFTNAPTTTMASPKQ